MKRCAAIREVLIKARRQKRKFNTFYIAVVENEFGEINGLITTMPKQSFKRATVVMNRMGAPTNV